MFHTSFSNSARKQYHSHRYQLLCSQAIPFAPVSSTVLAIYLLLCLQLAPVPRTTVLATTNTTISTAQGVSSLFLGPPELFVAHRRYNNSSLHWFITCILFRVVSGVIMATLAIHHHVPFVIYGGQTFEVVPVIVAICYSGLLVVVHN